MNTIEQFERSKSSEKIDFTKIPCLDQQDPLVPVRNSSKIIVEPIWQKADDLEGQLYARYIAAHPEYDTVYVRSKLLERLERAAGSLDDTYRLIVRAGHRPLTVQRQVLQGVIDDYKLHNPHASDEEALAHGRIYVSDPAIKLPPHCCGAAVDIDLLDTRSGHVVDFGSPVNEDSDISHLHSGKITAKQQENRVYLLDKMLAAGFASYYAEWWHYSYGDKIWAWFYSRDACLYGIIER